MDHGTEEPHFEMSRGRWGWRLGGLGSCQPGDGSVVHGAEEERRHSSQDHHSWVAGRKLGRLLNVLEPLHPPAHCEILEYFGMHFTSA